MSGGESPFRAVPDRASYNVGHEIAFRVHCAAVWRLYPVDAKGVPEGEDGAAGGRVGAEREFAAPGFLSPSSGPFPAVRGWACRSLSARGASRASRRRWAAAARWRSPRLPRSRGPGPRPAGQRLQDDVDLRCLGVPAFHRLALALSEGLAELGRLEREDLGLLLVDLPLLGELLGLELSIEAWSRPLAACGRPGPRSCR